jgi:hypothetical protein
MWVFFLPSQRPVARVLSWSCALLFTVHFLLTGPSAFLLSMLHGVEDSSLRTAKTLYRKFEKKFPEIKMRGLLPNSYIHEIAIHIPAITQIHECGHWQRGRAVTFLGIHTSDLVCSVYLELCDRSFLLHICGFVAVSVSMTRWKFEKKLQV